MRTVFKSLITSAAIVFTFVNTCHGFSDRVKDLVKNMSLKDKVGQMTQVDIGMVMSWDGMKVDEGKVRQLIKEHRLGSFLNSPLAGGGNPNIWTAKEWREAMRTIQKVAKEEGVLPLIHGLDSVHGANYVKSATIFPQQVGIGATFNRKYAREMGRVTAQDTMAGGVQWVFGPILDLGVNSRWPRQYECFSEDPHLVAVMGAEVISGMQAYSYQNLSTAACMKHFIAYSATSTGQDQSPILLDKRDIGNYYLVPYRAAVKAGIKTAMEMYAEISGVPMVSSREYLKELLRYELGFDGLLVTDYSEINSLHGDHAVAQDNREAVEISIRDTSIDMSMTAWDTDFASDLFALVQAGKISETRVDESVSRILQTKEEIGLLDHAFTLLGEESPMDDLVGSKADKEIALDAIRESVTLLKNKDHVLPLSPTKAYNILVVGPVANSLTYQSGGWTLKWISPLGDEQFSYGTTLYEAISQMAAKGSVVDYLPGTDTEGKFLTRKDQLADRAAQADVIIVGIGEKAYAEASANIPDLALPPGQEELLTLLAGASTTAPIVTVLFEGRPRLLGAIPTLSDAVLHGYLPGPEGGIGVGEIIFGLTNPSGRIPFTYPKHQNGPTLLYYHKIRQHDYDVQWAFGEGLSYTTFAYENLQISAPTTDEKTPVQITATVRNTGTRAGKHTVLLFAFDIIRRVTPEYKLLKAFEKTKLLQPGESQVVSFEIDPAESLSFYGVDRHRIVESGEFRFALGEETDCRRQNASAASEHCLKLTLNVSSQYNPLCEEACRAWGRIQQTCLPILASSSNITTTTTTTQMKNSESSSLKEKLGTISESACSAQCQKDKDWQWNMVDCFRDIVLEPHALCHKVDRICRNPF